MVAIAATASHLKYGWGTHTRQNQLECMPRIQVYETADSRVPSKSVVRHPSLFCKFSHWIYVLLSLTVIYIKKCSFWQRVNTLSAICAYICTSANEKHTQMNINFLTNSIIFMLIIPISLRRMYIVNSSIIKISYQSISKIRIIHSFVINTFICIVSSWLLARITCL